MPDDLRAAHGQTTAATTLSDGSSQSQQLFHNDRGRRSADVREVLTILMTDRVLDGRRKPKQWQVLMDYEGDVRSILHEFYLDLIVSPEHQVAFKRQIKPEHAHRVLLPNRASSVEFGVGVILLADRLHRASYVETSGGKVHVTRTEFREAWELMWGDITAKAIRLNDGDAAIKQLCQEDLLIGQADAEEWEISPAVAVLYDADEINRFTDGLITAGLEPDDLGDDDAADDYAAGADL